jgi:AraC-like DNA-binding protein
MFGKSENRDDYQYIQRPAGGMARNLPKGLYIDFHEHPRGQLIYATEGAVLVNTLHGTWIVPSHRAVWVPPYTQHAMRACGKTALRTVYLHVEAIPADLTKCCVVAVSPLLRELISEVAGIPVEYDETGRDGLVVRLLLAELKPMKVVPLYLPMPKDQRIARICRKIEADPTDETSIEAWSACVGASERTIVRLFQSQTGMSYRQWKQQARLMSAIQMLAEGKNVTDVAVLCGYESPSAFSAMFRKLLGMTPSEYFRNIL